MTNGPSFLAGDLILTPDGSRTALSLRYGEAYGSRHGAAAQARHVFVEGSGTHTHPAPRVLEVGFGLGANFRATLEQCARRGAALTYLAYEFDPAPTGLLRAVAEGSAGADHPAWAAALAGWGRASPLTVRLPGVALSVVFGDVREAGLPSGWATAVYLDGFSPARNPEVWTPDLVGRLAGSLAPGGVLTTYSAAGHVRRTLAGAGLTVERRPGPPGKRECLRAVRPA
ncbi:tRNA (5-methylaminomethyl-2-thiouridine)(34)-methyltransferase MnmD [Deinococcus budaensis]|uniref:tRNA U34 5-methylaminomethyl-2-thiouridine-forming methyltransferase MnmC n=1 Tax=Deinococcus budaensis TaxID=1665626 RepID=A0A7W8GDA8_9DEIO|nr:tRNA (5-methylaminomethyl-2-thiouridine)(34)-methyltransferase MnmD [Deinococcus budaensis]MBB5233477.1 tRNA U34 5-methylaminomethyl-2-thiouridine-forming methyltransferase MnmC [Deinococcus budaensis]